MKININIKEDKELRDYIKGLLKEQIKQYTREVYKDIINEEISRLLANNKITPIINDNIVRISFNLLAKEIGYNSYSSDFLNPAIEKILNKRINKIDMERLIKDKLDELLKKVLINKIGQ